MSVILTIKANDRNSQSLAPLAVMGRVKGKRKLWESEDISFHVSFSHFVGDYFYYCGYEDIFLLQSHSKRRLEQFRCKDVGLE